MPRKDIYLDIFGILSLPVLIISIITFGYLEPNYSHVTMPVSSLGAIAATNTIPMNVFGLFIPGMLVCCSAFGFKCGLMRNGVKFNGFYVLLAFGLMFAGLAFPLDAPPSYMEKYTIHYVFAYSTPWIYLAASGITYAQIRSMKLPFIYRLSFIAFPTVFLIFGLIPKTTFGAGVTQRVLLFCCFSWVVSLSIFSIQLKIYSKLSQ